jgi:hypothetical protein
MPPQPLPEPVNARPIESNAPSESMSAAYQRPPGPSRQNLTPINYQHMLGDGWRPVRYGVLPDAALGKPLYTYSRYPDQATGSAGNFRHYTESARQDLAESKRWDDEERKGRQTETWRKMEGNGAASSPSPPRERICDLAILQKIRNAGPDNDGHVCVV